MADVARNVAAEGLKPKELFSEAIVKKDEENKKKPQGPREQRQGYRPPATLLDLVPEVTFIPDLRIRESTYQPQSFAFGVFASMTATLPNLDADFMKNHAKGYLAPRMILYLETMYVLRILDIMRTKMELGAEITDLFKYLSEHGLAGWKIPGPMVMFFEALNRCLPPTAEFKEIYPTFPTELEYFDTTPILSDSLVSVLPPLPYIREKLRIVRAAFTQSNSFPIDWRKITQLTPAQIALLNVNVRPQVRFNAEFPQPPFANGGATRQENMGKIQPGVHIQSSESAYNRQVNRQFFINLDEEMPEFLKHAVPNPARAPAVNAALQANQVANEAALPAAILAGLPPAQIQVGDTDLFNYMGLNDGDRRWFLNLANDMSRVAAHYEGTKTFADIAKTGFYPAAVVVIGSAGPAAAAINYRDDGTDYPLWGTGIMRELKADDLDLKVAILTQLNWDPPAGFAPAAFPNPRNGPYWNRTPDTNLPIEARFYDNLRLKIESTWKLSKE